MRLATTVPYARDPRPLLDRVAGWEDAGLDVAWVAELYGFDAPTLLGYLAARTRRMQLGSAILPIYSRSPALLAQTAASLDAVSGGRAILGIGASGPQVVEGWHGVPFDRPVARLREVVEICRQVWRREPLRHEGIYPLPLPPDQGTGLGRPLRLINKPTRDRVPVYVAALGDRSVRLAAEVADGWLPAFFVPEKAAQVWGPALAAGAAARDPALGPLEVSAGGLLAIGPDVLALRDRARPALALYLGGMGARNRNFYFDLACRYGYADAARTVQDLYLAGRRAEAAAAVPAELVELTTLVGPAGHVRDRVEAFRAAGVTILTVDPVGPDPVRQLAQLKEWL